MFGPPALTLMFNVKIGSSLSKTFALGKYFSKNIFVTKIGHFGQTQSKLDYFGTFWPLLLIIKLGDTSWSLLGLLSTW